MQVPEFSDEFQAAKSLDLQNGAIKQWIDSKYMNGEMSSKRLLSGDSIRSSGYIVRHDNDASASSSSMVLS